MPHGAGRFASRLYIDVDLAARPQAMVTRMFIAVFVLAAAANSLLIGAAVTTINILLGVPAWRALGTTRPAEKDGLVILILSPLIVPGIAVIMGIQVVFIRMGRADTRTGVILSHLLPMLPYMILVMKGAFANYDSDFEVRARSLGSRPCRCCATVRCRACSPA